MTDQYLKTAEMLSEVFLMCLSVIDAWESCFCYRIQHKEGNEINFFKAPTFLGTLLVPLKVSSAQTTT